MADKVIITTDTGSDLRPENLEKFHIDGMIPFHITLGDKSYLDFYECQPDDLFRFFEEHNQVPKTAACSPHDFYEFFEPFAQQGCDIVHIAMNSVFSSSYANSLIAAEEIKKTYGTSVFSVDTYTLTGAQALMAIRAAELRDGGMPAGQIAEEIRAMIPHVRTNFLLGGMNYAAKGGRCSMLVAFGANLLKLYPMMHIDEKGIITSPKKFRGSVKSVQDQYMDYVLDLADKYADYKRVLIGYTSDNRELIANMHKRLKQYGKFQEIIESVSNCTTATHGGPNTMYMIFADR
ncbi:MAG: DegV family protein [Clostridia bacterium]|nr:DegV family protein [Clostridia bacterium]MBQ1555167.1 DegV family protein [Clostridia bacterium]